MNRNLKAIINEMDRKTEYKKKSTTITKEGTLLNVGSEDGRQELAMVLKFVKGSRVGNPHEDYIVIGTYKYSDINAAIITNSDQKPPILLIIAKVTGKNSYRILRNNQLELMQRIKKEAGKDKKISERCDDLFKFELIQCLSTEMSLTYSTNKKGDTTEGSILNTNDVTVDLSGVSDIEANSIAIVEDQEGKYDTTAMLDTTRLED